MSYLLGEDPRADGRWLHVLNWSARRPECRRDLFHPGVTPEHLLEGVGFPPSFPPELVQRLHRDLRDAPPAYIVNGVDASLPIQLVTLADVDYPPLLRQCADAPAGLFVVGDVTRLSSLSVAIVGSRKPSIDGRRAATEYGAALSQAGLTVVSGLALGVDGAAHIGALRERGSTVAVMATGIDTVYPARHRHLARDIAHHGAVVTEFLPGATPQSRHFHRRNRTISGLALGTLVVEAGRPSGSLITATAAAQQGRDVFALPWSLYHRGAEGCHALLADGAHLALSPGDIMTELGLGITGQLALNDSLLESPNLGDQGAEPAGEAVSAMTSRADAISGDKRWRPNQTARDNISGVEGDILKQLGDATHSIDTIAASLVRPVADIRIYLGRLELSGRIERVGAGYRRLR